MKLPKNMQAKVRWVLYPLVLPLFMSCMTLMPEKITASKPPGAVPESKAALRQSILNEAEKYINVPYGSPPRVPVTFDCSAFVNYIFTKAANMPLAVSSSRDYVGIGREIDFKDAQAGDVLIFTSQPGGAAVDHVAILYQKSAIGELRGSLLIHAVSIPIQSAGIKGDPGKPSVVISELGKRGDGNWKNEYFLSRYKCTKRFIEG
jgi:cell wall-associated NlpC family hydrolase